MTAARRTGRSHRPLPRRRLAAERSSAAATAAATRCSGVGASTRRLMRRLAIVAQRGRARRRCRRRVAAANAVAADGPLAGSTPRARDCSSVVDAVAAADQQQAGRTVEEAERLRPQHGSRGVWSIIVMAFPIRVRGHVRRWRARCAPPVPLAPWCGRSAAGGGRRRRRTRRRAPPCTGRALR